MDRPAELRRIERSFRDPPRPSEQAAIEGLRGAALLLMVAAFESFLRDEFAERVDEYWSSTRARKFDDLPYAVKKQAVHGYLSNAVRSRPWDRRTDDEKMSYAINVAGSVSSRTLVGEAFARTDGSAGPQSVNRLFSQVALNDVFDASHSRFGRYWKSPAPRGFARQKLEAIISSRNAIAHGSSALRLSRQDLAESDRLLRVLAKTIDDELRIHLNALR